MDFELTMAQKTLQRELRALVEDKYGLEYWRRLDAEHEFPEEFWHDMAEQGYLGLSLPEEWGGVGGDMLDVVLAIEAMCGAGPGMGAGFLMVLTIIFAGTVLARYGTDEQKERYLRPLCEGKGIWALGVTEPDAGTDTLSMKTRAVRQPDGRYSITGAKVFTSGADRSVRMVIPARTRPVEELQRRTEGIGLFAVDPKAAGVKIDLLDKVGFHFVNTTQVFLDDVVVGPEDRIGGDDQGWKVLMDILIPERLGVAAQAVGTGELALRLAVDYAKERQVFGRPIGTYQAIQLPLADLHSRIEAARWLSYRAAWLFDQGKPEAGATANKAKFLACEAGYEAADRAIQTMGGYGYTSDYYVERLWREMRLLKIAPVTQDMSLLHIADRELGLGKSY